jgi:hypothetical protein
MYYISLLCVFDFGAILSLLHNYNTKLIFKTLLKVPKVLHNPSIHFTQLPVMLASYVTVVQFLEPGN